MDYVAANYMTRNPSLERLTETAHRAGTAVKAAFSGVAPVEAVLKYVTHRSDYQAAHAEVYGERAMDFAGVDSYSTLDQYITGTRDHVSETQTRSGKIRSFVESVLPYGSMFQESRRSATVADFMDSIKSSKRMTVDEFTTRLNEFTMSLPEGRQMDYQAKLAAADLAIRYNKVTLGGMTETQALESIAHSTVSAYEDASYIIGKTGQAVFTTSMVASGGGVFANAIGGAVGVTFNGLAGGIVGTALTKTIGTGISAGANYANKAVQTYADSHIENETIRNIIDVVGDTAAGASSIIATTGLTGASSAATLVLYGGSAAARAIAKKTEGRTRDALQWAALGLDAATITNSAIGLTGRIMQGEHVQHPAQPVTRNNSTNDVGKYDGQLQVQLGQDGSHLDAQMHFDTTGIDMKGNHPGAYVLADMDHDGHVIEAIYWGKDGQLHCNFDQDDVKLGGYQTGTFDAQGNLTVHLPEGVTADTKIWAGAGRFEGDSQSNELIRFTHWTNYAAGGQTDTSGINFTHTYNRGDETQRVFDSAGTRHDSNVWFIDVKDQDTLLARANDQMQNDPRFSGVMALTAYAADGTAHTYFGHVDNSGVAQFDIHENLSNGWQLETLTNAHMEDGKLVYGAMTSTNSQTQNMHYDLSFHGQQTTYDAPTPVVHATAPVQQGTATPVTEPNGLTSVAETGTAANVAFNTGTVQYDAQDGVMKVTLPSQYDTAQNTIYVWDNSASKWIGYDNHPGTDYLHVKPGMSIDNFLIGVGPKAGETFTMGYMTDQTHIGTFDYVPAAAPVVAEAIPVVQPNGMAIGPNVDIAPDLKDPSQWFGYNSQITASYDSQDGVLKIDMPAKYDNMPIWVWDEGTALWHAYDNHAGTDFLAVRPGQSLTNFMVAFGEPTTRQGQVNYLQGGNYPNDNAPSFVMRTLTDQTHIGTFDYVATPAPAVPAVVTPIEAAVSQPNGWYSPFETPMAPHVDYNVGSAAYHDATGVFRVELPSQYDSPEFKIFVWDPGFVTATSGGAVWRGYDNNPGTDFIQHDQWRDPSLMMIGVGREVTLPNGTQTFEMVDMIDQYHIPRFTFDGTTAPVVVQPGGQPEVVVVPPGSDAHQPCVVPPVELPVSPVTSGYPESALTVGFNHAINSIDSQALLNAWNGVVSYANTDRPSQDVHAIMASQEYRTLDATVDAWAKDSLPEFMDRLTGTVTTDFITHLPDYQHNLLTYDLDPTLKAWISTIDTAAISHTLLDVQSEIHTVWHDIYDNKDNLVIAPIYQQMEQAWDSAVHPFFVDLNSRFDYTSAQLVNYVDGGYFKGDMNALNPVLTQWITVDLPRMQARGLHGLVDDFAGQQTRDYIAAAKQAGIDYAGPVNEPFVNLFRGNVIGIADWLTNASLYTESHLPEIHDVLSNPEAHADEYKASVVTDALIASIPVHFTEVRNFMTTTVPNFAGQAHTYLDGYATALRATDLAGTNPQVQDLATRVETVSTNLFSTDAHDGLTSWSEWAVEQFNAWDVQFGAQTVDVTQATLQWIKDTPAIAIVQEGATGNLATNQYFQPWFAQGLNAVLQPASQQWLNWKAEADQINAARDP